MNPRILLSILLCIAATSACSKLDAPTPGTYRAYVKVRGGEVPFELQVTEQNGQSVLKLINGDDTRAATNFRVTDGALQAELPDAAGTLSATLDRNSMQGELRLIDQHGKPQTLPFAGKLNQPYRFVEKSSTDNADISGYWQLEAISPEHFSAPVSITLQQRFDAVDGKLLLPDGQGLPLLGQVHGDDVYLAALAQGRALLLKGKVNQRGELNGELWTNLSNAREWVARRMPDDSVTAAAPPSVQPAAHWAAPATDEH